MGWLKGFYGWFIIHGKLEVEFDAVTRQDKSTAMLLVAICTASIPVTNHVLGFKKL